MLAARVVAGMAPRLLQTRGSSLAKGCFAGRDEAGVADLGHSFVSFVLFPWRWLSVRCRGSERGRIGLARV